MLPPPVACIRPVPHASWHLVSLCVTLATRRNAAAAIVCFDITDEQSFEMMKDWVEELKKNVPEGKLVIAIACTKADLDAQRVGETLPRVMRKEDLPCDSAAVLSCWQVVSKARAQQYAASIKAVIMETSAKDNWGVTELFHRVAERVIEAKGDELLMAQSTQQQQHQGMRISAQAADAGAQDGQPARHARPCRGASRVDDALSVALLLAGRSSKKAMCC